MGVFRHLGLGVAGRSALLIDYGRITPTQPSPIEGEG